jgi:hypothetical protein
MIRDEMTTGPDQERQRLLELYAAMGEPELLRLADQATQLTDLARMVLAGEIARRKLEPSVTAPETSLSVNEVEAQDLATVRQFRDLPQALLAKGALDSAGIECFLVDQNMVRMDWFISNLLGGIKLQVKAVELNDALAVLSEPIPESFEVDGVGSYQQPQCPRCASFEIIDQAGIDKRFALLGLAVASIPLPLTRKSWRCQSCGQEWLDGEPAKP